VNSGASAADASQVVIYLYYKNHPPPHIHAVWAVARRSSRSCTGEMMEGPRPWVARLVAGWVPEHPDELAIGWEKATRGEEPSTIEPLQ
jgi:hypothetical protein